MTINIKRDMENLTIAIEGRLDTITAPELEDDMFYRCSEYRMIWGDDCEYTGG